MVAISTVQQYAMNALAGVYSLADQVGDLGGRVYGVYSRLASSLDMAVQHTKILDSFVAIKRDFFEISPTDVESELLKGVKGPIKGFTAFATLPGAALTLKDKVEKFFDDLMLLPGRNWASEFSEVKGSSRLLKSGIDLSQMVCGFGNKMYECISFVGTTLKDPVANAIAKASEVHNFRAVVVGSMLRVSLAVDQLVGYLTGRTMIEDREVKVSDKQANILSLKVVEGLSVAAMATTILRSPSSKCTITALGATAAAAKLFGFYYNEIAV